MKRFFTLLLIAAAPFAIVAQPCTTSDAIGCSCPDGSQDCDLLPDITISWQCLENGADGPTETPGMLKVSGSTPNMGFGPLNMRGADKDGYRWFVCGTDTVSIHDPGSTENFECPNGAVPEHIVIQRIYHKSGNDMTFWERMVPNAMSYHPGHGHNHFDEWGVFTLRYQDLTTTNPLNWPIVATGHKLGFCLMDYYTCPDAPNGDCRDDNTVYDEGNVMNDESDFPNYRLGGGNYGCGQVSQGISVGYTDVYYEHLDGMWIDIPDEVCNGDYWIVYEVDPNDVVIEQNEDNNFTAIPFTLTQQGSGTATAKIYSETGAYVCEDDSVLLTATAGSGHLWSTGSTSTSIYGFPGQSYSVEVTGNCGSATSPSISLTEVARPGMPVTTDDTVCIATPVSTVTATLLATGSNIEWYDEGGDVVGSGNTFITPEISETTDYYAADLNIVEPSTTFIGKFDNSGGGGNFNGNQHLVFDTYLPVTIKSVKVYAEGAGNRTIVIMDQVGMHIASDIFYLEDGEQRVELNMAVPAGLSNEIGLIGEPNLFRNSSNTNYPYTIPDTLSITSSTAESEDYYYFFYDWEVAGVETTVCNSEMVQATANVELCTGILDDYDMSNRISAFPNPNGGEFTLDIRMPGTGNVTATVVDLTGRKIFERSYDEVTGNFTKNINLGDAAAGVYGLSLQIDNHIYFKRLSVY